MKQNGGGSSSGTGASSRTSSSAGSSSMRANLQMESTSDHENALLDEIEAGTKRIKVIVSCLILRFLSINSLLLQSKNIHQESVQSTALLNKLEIGLERTSNNMRNEAQHMQNATNAAASRNYCWMYMVIVVEVITFFTLLNYGMS